MTAHPESGPRPLTKEERRTIIYNARAIIAGGDWPIVPQAESAKTILAYEATLAATEARLAGIRDIVWNRFADYTGDPLFVALSVAFEKYDAAPVELETARRSPPGEERPDRVLVVAKALWGELTDTPLPRCRKIAEIVLAQLDRSAPAVPSDDPETRP